MTSAILECNSSPKQTATMPRIRKHGRVLVLFATLIGICSTFAIGQVHDAAISVSMSAESAIQITFSQAPSGCPLTPAPDYSNVSLYLGTFDNNGNNTGCAAYFRNTPSKGRYTISTGFNVQVDKFYSASSSYTLSVRLQSPPPGPASALNYLIQQGTSGTQTSLNTAPQIVIPNGAYGSPFLQVLSIQVRSSTAPVGVIARTIEYSAVAN